MHMCLEGKRFVGMVGPMPSGVCGISLPRLSVRSAICKAGRVDAVWTVLRAYAHCGEHVDFNESMESEHLCSTQLLACGQS